MKKHVTIKEIASLLGRSVKTVRRRVSRGLIPVIQEGGKGTVLRFDPDDVLRAVKTNQFSAEAPTGEVKDSTPDQPTSQRRSGPMPKWKTKSLKRKDA